MKRDITKHIENYNQKLSKSIPFYPSDIDALLEISGSDKYALAYNCLRLGASLGYRNGLRNGKNASKEKSE